MNNFHLRFPQGKAKALTLSYDDGVEQDEKLIGIMKQNGLKGTFNLNSGRFAAEGFVYPAGQVHRPLSEAKARQLYSDPDVEVAIHGLTHPFFERIPANRMVYEAVKDRENLERLFGKIVTGMAYPYGTYSDDVLRVMADCGITYSRTVAQTEGFDLPLNWLALNPTCRHANPNLMPLLERFTAARPGGNPQMYYLWGHSYEFEQFNNWDIIERFAAEAGGHDDIWYATNGEICDYCRDFGRLVFSMDGSIVHNPTARTIWFLYNGGVGSIDSGCSLRF